MSSAEFLTFYRRAAGSSSILRQTIARPQTIRPFSAVSARCYSANKMDGSVATEQYPDGEHATDKKDKLDIQSEQSHKGRE